ncbi:FliM/FliN family flagellar motor switch protein [Candidatus Regiella endosymbiont of Tuberolachnus salignus]|uniref:FliM/FliN family flagellar motor switch protein n=1 Tax=Candidatus Regiella endosymbiont of Tuberolachnus salignus TaxID=3077956 RepID=UPI0030CC9CD8
MSQLRLRQFVQSREDRAEKLWLARGITVTRSVPDSACELLEFTADDRWQGIIKLRDWFHHVAPDLAALSSKAYSSEQLKALFMTTPRPFELGIEELSYQKLQAIGLLDADQISPALMLCVETPMGFVWLRQLPDLDFLPSESMQKLPVLGLPLPLLFEIGVSRLSLKWLKKLALGDVLLITQKTSHVISNGVCIGRYQKKDQYIMIEKKTDYEEDDNEDFDYDELEDELDDELDINEEKDNDDHNDQPHSQKPVSDSENQAAIVDTAKVPIKLTFILDKKDSTVAELAEMYKGKKIKLEPNAENNIKIKANGRTIAKGELKQFEDRLGVELTEIYRTIS